jgi:adenine-specific DNA-methyltransferase
MHKNTTIGDSISSQADDSVARLRFEEILKSLGKPRYRGDNYAIYLGDCRVLLAKLPAGAVDLTFTSPPYNIGKVYEIVRPMEEYIDWCAEWLARLHRVTAHDGALLLNVGYVSLDNRAKAIPIPYLLWNRVPFYLQQEIVWNYGAGVAGKNFLSPRNEKILWYVKDAKAYCFNLDDIRDPDVAYPNQKKKGKLRCNTIGKNPSDVWQIAKVTSGAGRASKERTRHPAQFPLDLCDRAIRGFSSVDDVVLDPFLGSGSTIDACLRLQRYSIGFEISEEYCELAEQRIQGALRQAALEF